MPHSRCFRIAKDDVEQLRERIRDQRVCDAYARWAEHFSPKLDEVIATITDAFSGVELGHGIGLFEAAGIDDYASDRERSELRAQDEKTDWRRITVEDLERCYASPSYFDRQGFVFHLPAFLIAALNDRHPYGFIDRLIQTSQPPEGWPELLTSAQRETIIAALLLVAEHPEYSERRSPIEETVEHIRSVKTSSHE